MLYRSRRAMLLANVASIALCGVAVAQTENEEDSRSFRVSHALAAPKDLVGPYPSTWEPLRLDHRVSANGIADFFGPTQLAVLESRVSSAFTATDNDYYPGPPEELSEEVCSSRVRVFGDAGVNPACGVLVEFTLMGDVFEALELSSTSNLVGDTPGELVETLPSRGLGNLDFTVGPTTLRLVYTVQNVAAGASLHFECSTAPTARLEGALRARPGRVAVNGSLVDWKPGYVYEKKISSRIFLGELRSFPDMVSEPAAFSAHVPWQWDIVLLRLILKMAGTSYSPGGLFSLGTYETEGWTEIVGDASTGTFPPGSSVIGW